MTLTRGAYHTSRDWPTVEAAPGIERRVLSCGDQLMVVQFTVQAGAQIPFHAHPHEQVGHVVSGQLLLRIDQEERELGPGDGYSIPGGVLHGATGITPAVVVDTFHPVRGDFR